MLLEEGAQGVVEVVRRQEAALQGDVVEQGDDVGMGEAGCGGGRLGGGLGGARAVFRAQALALGDEVAGLVPAPLDAVGGAVVEELVAVAGRVIALAGLAVVEEDVLMAAEVAAPARGVGGEVEGAAGAGEQQRGVDRLVVRAGVLGADGVGADQRPGRTGGGLDAQHKALPGVGVDGLGQGAGEAAGGGRAGRVARCVAHEDALQAVELLGGVGAEAAVADLLVAPVDERLEDVQQRGGLGLSLRRALAVGGLEVEPDQAGGGERGGCARRGLAEGAGQVFGQALPVAEGRGAVEQCAAHPRRRRGGGLADGQVGGVRDQVAGEDDGRELVEHLHRVAQLIEGVRDLAGGEQGVEGRQLVGDGGRPAGNDHVEAGGGVPAPGQLGGPAAQRGVLMGAVL